MAFWRSPAPRMRPITALMMKVDESSTRKKEQVKNRWTEYKTNNDYDDDRKLQHSHCCSSSHVDVFLHFPFTM